MARIEAAALFGQFTHQTAFEANNDF